ncbi:IS110 family transposase, partial [Corynebacterium accolens]|nr:IS110 family transposase [Corynebacterium accolens]
SGWSAPSISKITSPKPETKKKSLPNHEVAPLRVHDLRATPQSSFASIRFHERFRQFYERKRKEGKRLNAAAT